MQRGKTHILEVWGDFACFTRPEMKVERYSYPVITPSAARGIFDAIYWKKSYNFYWQIERIEVLSPPKYIALRRNEVKNKALIKKEWIAGEGSPVPLWADEMSSGNNGRTQRQTMALKDVRYQISAHMCFRSKTGNPRTFDEQFERRASHGKCAWQPYFGCREFVAYFQLGQDLKSAIESDVDIGWMVYDVFDLRRQNTNKAKPFISVFQAMVTNGSMIVPEFESDAVRKPEAS